MPQDEQVEFLLAATCRQVVCHAASPGEGGEVLALHRGGQVRIVEVAKQLAAGNNGCTSQGLVHHVREPKALAMTECGGRV